MVGYRLEMVLNETTFSSNVEIKEAILQAFDGSDILYSFLVLVGVWCSFKDGFGFVSGLN